MMHGQQNVKFRELWYEKLAAVGIYPCWPRDISTDLRRAETVTVLSVSLVQYRGPSLKLSQLY
jgi:hypothetical protein